MPSYAGIVRHLLYPLDVWRSGDRDVLRFRGQFERSQWLSGEQLRELTWTRLRQLVDHAYRHCPFYRHRFDLIGLMPSDLTSLEDLALIPILEKEDIQLHRDDMVAENWPRADLIPNQTGGSTGAPISFYLSGARHRSRMAAMWRHNAWADYDVGDKAAYVWGATPDAPHHSLKQWWRNLLIDRVLYLDAAHITEEKMRFFHTALGKFRPKVIQAYARSLALFAQYLKSRSLLAYQPDAIITSAEALSSGDRTLIEEVFGCSVYNRYGCREFGVIASECGEHDGMHVMEEGLHVEVVCGSRPAYAKEPGSILVTDLLNLAMPMIRYRIGDMARSDGNVCRCGRGLQTLQGIEGRVTDFLVAGDGSLVSGVFLATYVIANAASIGQVQLYQDSPGRVLYRIRQLPGKATTRQDLTFVECETKRHLGANTRVDFEFVDEIPNGPSGKFLYCISKLKPTFS
jgi:phenylacetate-CoA ligase